MVCNAMGIQKKIPITQLHWGGGTPTFLSHEEMIELMHHTKQHFDLLPEGEYSIEIDPRRVSEQDIKLDILLRDSAWINLNGIFTLWQQIKMLLSMMH